MRQIKTCVVLFFFGSIPIIWLALKVAPYADSSLMDLLLNTDKVLSEPLKVEWCENSLRTVLIFFLFYAMGIGIVYSTKRNYRRGEEHGSARWGNAGQIDKKYRDRKPANNKLLTQNVRIGLDGRKHRRNLNTIVCGGSGAGKTRFFCKPNAMQCNTSFVILDPRCV